MSKLATSFWIRCYTSARRKCLGHSVAGALLGIAVFVAPLPRALAQEQPTNVGRSGFPDDPVYPLKASGNNRYLVDQNNTPFLMVGDSPQNLIVNLSPKEAAAFMANRRNYGINTLWINLLCIFTESCRTDATTFDQIEPFLVRDDIATPNPAYFQRVDDMLRIASDYGMVVLLDPIETISWLDVLRKNGEAKSFEYGRYLGNRYKDVPNIIWMHGNDFQSWRNAADDALVQAVARGIRSVDENHIHTVELNYETSGSLEDESWAPLIELNAAYTYLPTYAQVLTEYNRRSFKPVIMVEAIYEFARLDTGRFGSPQNLRRQEYWAMLSGAAGQLYGSVHAGELQKGWEANMDTPGVIQLSYMKNLFLSRRWYDLVPDQAHMVVTGGYDSFSCSIGKFVGYVGKVEESLVARMARRIRKYSGMGSVASDTCATAARAVDGSLVVAYVPTIRAITVDMTKLAGTTTARWYDPTSGEYSDIKGSPFANEGSRQFVPSGANKSGEDDWVLILEASPPR